MAPVTNALIVNFFGGPGGGKTTAGALLFTELKLRGMDIEMDMELARQMILMEHLSALECQPYLFGVALYKLRQTARNTEVVIMDSPLLLNPIYDKFQSPALRALSIEEHNRFRNFNVFVNRPRNASHSMAGRVHNLQESLLLDERIKAFLREIGEPFIEISGEIEDIRSTADRVVEDVQA
ncbi:MAG: ATP-binding protein, partial [Gemmatimonadota bacterium]|nr:ATP-binding protein [Gemmatimonadota bacterium]